MVLLFLVVYSKLFGVGPRRVKSLIAPRGLWILGLWLSWAGGFGGADGDGEAVA